MTADVELLPLPEGEAIGWAQACSYAQMRDYARANVEQAEARAERLAEALRWAERHCPCGARPESPDTHPHMPGCPIGDALLRDLEE